MGTTSNITGTVDVAFVDGADIKQYIGNPSTDACFSMLRGSMMELRNKGAITCNETIYPLSIVKFENDTLSNSQGIDLMTNGMMNDHINNDHEEFESSKK